jgi:hypothetical protein
LALQEAVDVVIPKKIRYTQRVAKPVVVTKPLSPKSPKRQSLSPSRERPQQAQLPDDETVLYRQKGDHDLRKRSPSPSTKSPRSPVHASSSNLAVPKIEYFLSFPSSMTSNPNSEFLSKSIAGSYPTPKPCVKCGKPSKYSHAKRHVRICSLACYQKL